MTTPLFHAQVIGGPTGLSFRLGPSMLFAPIEEHALYLVDPAHLLITAPVATPMAQWWMTYVIEPRLARLSPSPVGPSTGAPGGRART